MNPNIAYKEIKTLFHKTLRGDLLTKGVPSKSAASNIN